MALICPSLVAVRVKSRENCRSVPEHVQESRVCKKQNNRMIESPEGMLKVPGPLDITSLLSFLFKNLTKLSDTKW